MAINNNRKEGTNLAFIVTKSHFNTLQWWWDTWHSNFSGCFWHCQEFSFFLCEAIHQRSIEKKKNMKLVAANVFHNCKGQLYLALLFPFQKKSDTFFKNLINYNFLFSLNSNLFQKRHRLKLSWRKTNHPLTLRMTLTVEVLDLNAGSDNENFFLIVFTVTLFKIFNAVCIF